MSVREQLEPTIQNFIKGLDELEHKYIKKNEEVQSQLGIAVDTDSELREKIKENQKVHELTQEKLREETEKVKTLQVELQKEINDTQSYQRTLEKEKWELDDILQNAKAERVLAVDVRKKLDSAIKDYEDKLAYLRTDQDKINARGRAVSDKERLSKAKEKDLLKREEKVIQSEQDVAIREIETKKLKSKLEFQLKRENG